MNYLDYRIILPEIDKTDEFLFEAIITSFSDSNEKKIRQSREVSITRYKQDGNDMLFHLFLTNVEIKCNVSVENIFFLTKTVSAFDEIEVEINNYGKIIKVVNYNKIVQRWEIMRAKLAIDNEGISAETYMQGISDLLKNEQELISFLSDYKMFGLYFSNLYRNSYSIDRKKKLIDCDNTLITERFYPKDEKFNTYLIKGIPADNNQSQDFIKYNGYVEYRDDKIDLATIDIEKEKTTIMYNIYKRTL